MGPPVIAPVFAFKARPAGKAPELTANVYGGEPPAAVKVALYEAPTTPSGSVPLICRAVIAIENAFLAV